MPVPCTLPYFAVYCIRFFSGGWDFHGTVFASGFCFSQSKSKSLDSCVFLDCWTLDRNSGGVSVRSFSFSSDAQNTRLFCVDRPVTVGCLFTFHFIRFGGFPFGPKFDLPYCVCKRFLRGLCIPGDSVYLWPLRIIILLSSLLHRSSGSSAAVAVLAAVPE